MPLRLPPPPPRAIETLREGLESLLSTPSSSIRTRTEELGESFEANIDVTSPHLVYSVDLNEVAEGRILSAARPTSWRYMLLDGESAQSAAELAIDDNGEVTWFSHVDEGPFVQATVAGVEFAERLEAELGADYELRLLSVPSVYLVAVWLHGADDLLIPLAPSPGSLESDRAYTEEQIISGLLELIERRTANEDPMP